jgi:hypothetical protein
MKNKNHPTLTPNLVEPLVVHGLVFFYLSNLNKDQIARKPKQTEAINPPTDFNVSCAKGVSDILPG